MINYKRLKDDMLIESRKTNDKLVNANAKLVDKNKYLEKEYNKINNLLTELELYLSYKGLSNIVEELKVKYDIWSDKND